METYPKKIKAVNVAGSYFAPDLFGLVKGRAKYDQVWVNDGGTALYLVRVNNDLTVTKRWIPWDSEIIQFYEVETFE